MIPLRKNNNFYDYSNKRCSFILTIKNNYKGLENTLRMCEKLVHSKDELIIIDGGSTDQTINIIKKYRKIIDIFISEQDTSVTQAFNKGILLARGQFIKNLAVGDIIHTEAMEKVIKILVSNPNIGVLVCGGIKKSKDGISVVWLPKGINYGNNPKDPLVYGACGTGFVIRRQIFSLGLIPILKPSDIEFIIRCIKKSVVVKFCRIKLFEHQIDGQSTIISAKKQWEKEYKKVVKDHFSKSFYMRFIIGNWLGNHPIDLTPIYIVIPQIKFLLLPFRFFYRKTIKTIEGKKPGKSYKKNNEYIWDGLFC